MPEEVRDITLRVRTTRDEGPTRSTERVDELGDHATKTTGRLMLLGRASDRLSRSFTKLAATAALAKAGLSGFRRESDVLQRVMYDVHKVMRGLGVALQAFLIKGLKFATISIGLMSASLVGVHALFIAGRFLVKSYHVALQGLAGGAAGAAAAIGLVAAAIRENQAAMFAYRGQGNNEFGSGARQAQFALRSLQADTQLAGAGAEALAKVYGEIAKSKTGFTGASKSILKGLGDFAAAGQPIEEGLQAASKLVIALQDKKTGFGGVTAAAKELGPAMEKAMEEAKKKGIDTKDELLKAIQDGTLAQMGGVTGQMDAVSNTMIGQLKKYFNMIRVQFADFGQRFLPEAKVGFAKMYQIFTKTMSATTNSITNFEKNGGFIDFLVSATEKVSNFYLRLIRDYLPKTKGMFDRLGDWWQNFKQGWHEVTQSLKPLLDGARVVEETFGKAWKPVWSELKERTKEFNRDIQRNKPAFLEFGAEIGETTVKLLKLLGMFEKVIINNLPFINKIVRAIGLMVEQFTEMFNMVSGMFGNRNAFMMFMAMGRALKTTRGTLVDRELVAKNMSVRAGSVSIAGAARGLLARGGRGAPGGSSADAVLGPSATRASGAVDTLASSSGRATTGLGHFSRALGQTTGMVLAQGRAAGIRNSQRQISNTQQQIIPHNSHVGHQARLRPGQGSAYAPAGRFTRLGRGMASLGGYGTYQQRRADRQAAGTGLKFSGGMGSLALSMGLSSISDRIDNRDISSGFALAGTAAMFSPKMGIGIAGGTLALKSGNALTAGAGGAAAGAAIGSNFGAMGTAIGTGVGFLFGVLKSGSTMLSIAAKKAAAQVDGAFARLQSSFMVNMALTEGTAREKFGATGGDTTIDDSMRAQARRIGNYGKIAKEGQIDPLDKQSLVGYSVAGTGIGAMVGTYMAAPFAAVIGPIALALGAAAGAVIGTVTGLATGLVAKGINNFFRGDDVKRARKQRSGAIAQLYAQGAISESEYNDLMKKKNRKFLPDESVDDDAQQAFLLEFEKKAIAYEEAYRDTEMMIMGKVNAIESMTGMAETDIIALAQKMNVNLADATEDFTEQLRRLGLLMVKTAEQVDQAFAEVITNSISRYFDPIIKQEQSPDVLNDIVKSLAQGIGNSGRQSTAEEQKTLFGAYTEQLGNYYGGDTTKAFFEMQRQIGSENAIAFNTPGHPLYGMGKTFYSGAAGQRSQEFLDQTESDLTNTVVAPQLAAVMAKQGLGFANQDQMQAVKETFKGLSVDDQERFVNVLSSGNFNQYGGNPIAFLQDFGVPGIGTATGQGLKNLSDYEKSFAMAGDNLEKEGILLEAQLKDTEDMAKFFSADAEKPEWWSKDALIEVFAAAGVGGDTRTPRGKGIGDTTSSRLAQTLSRHASMDSAISGKRMITSAFRTNNLGSMNSDHVTGRAYDLVGNQLGMYKTTVERNGGFAEFHGGSQNRHLHVVPGPGPMGDSNGPAALPQYSSAASSQPMGRGGITINLNVNGLGIKEAIPQIQAELQRSLYEYGNRQ